VSPSTDTGDGVDTVVDPPRQLGRYEILEHIGQGGMAEIYLACARGAEGFVKPVVLKRILPHRASNREFLQMFLDEARLAATLDHSNIVQVFDIGEEEGEHFFAMEFLDGEDVSCLTRELAKTDRQLPLEHAIRVVQGVCAGLHYAHEKVGADGAPLRIVHRDVSPQNIFITFEGEVKLVDFGIAKSTQQLLATQQGVLKGKVPYMSPEQCRGAPVDRRSDIYSAAVILWELTVGRRLVKGGDDVAMMEIITEQDAPTPSSLRPEYPPELEHIVMKGLRRQRDQRHQTAQELQLELEGFARERKLPVSPVALGQLMREVFHVSPEAGRPSGSKARDRARSVRAHVTRTLARYDAMAQPSPEPPPEQPDTQVLRHKHPKAKRGPRSGPEKTKREKAKQEKTKQDSPRPRASEGDGFGPDSHEWFNRGEGDTDVDHQRAGGLWEEGQRQRSTLWLAFILSAVILGGVLLVGWLALGR
jgi:serine/threonine protein kinase